MWVLTTGLAKQQLGYMYSKFLPVKDVNICHTDNYYCLNYVDTYNSYT